MQKLFALLQELCFSDFGVKSEFDFEMGKSRLSKNISKLNSRSMGRMNEKGQPTIRFGIPSHVFRKKNGFAFTVHSTVFVPIGHRSNLILMSTYWLMCSNYGS